MGVYGDNKNNIEVGTEYTFTIENRGTENAIYELYLEDGDGQKIDLKNLSYFYTRDETMLTDIDTAGIRISTNILDKYNLTKEEKKTVKLKITAANSSISFPIKLKVNYNAEAEDISSPNYKLCKASTSIHVEDCKQNSSTSFCSTSDQGQNIYNSDKTTPIIYGFFHNSAKDLITGEVGVAFDCDFNKDGIYDQVSERFYYVSPLILDSLESYDWTNLMPSNLNQSLINKNIAVLIYYSNVKDGLIDNNAPVAYNLKNDTYDYLTGPITAFKYLPTQEQWISFKDARYSKTYYRTLYDINATSHLINITCSHNESEAGICDRSFSYGDYAARFLTMQEIIKGCGNSVGRANSIWDISSLDYTCRFLLENTNYADPNKLYGYWLETRVQDTTAAWLVHTQNRYMVRARHYEYDIVGVRPAIEVNVSNLSY